MKEVIESVSKYFRRRHIQNALRESVRLYDDIAFYGDPKFGNLRRGAEEKRFDEILKTAPERVKNVASQVKKFNLFKTKYFKEYFSAGDIVAVALMFDLDTENDRRQSTDEMALSKIVNLDDNISFIPSTVIHQPWANATISGQPITRLELSLRRVMAMIGGTYKNVTGIKDTKPANNLERNFISLMNEIGEDNKWGKGALLMLREKKKLSS